MPGSASERVTVRAEEMSQAIYAALDAIDGYLEVVTEIAREQIDSDESNPDLLDHMNRFQARAEAMTRVIEDEVLTHLDSCTEDLASVEAVEKGDAV